MRQLILLAFFTAGAATAVAQPASPPKELTPQDVFAAKLQMQASGSVVQDEIVYLYLAQRSDTQAVARSEFVKAMNNTRTDVQIGASSSSPGATTLVEKPGAADLLQLAIESGAVSQTKNGTSVTLATTPYLLAGLFGVRDTPDAWRNYATLRHFALSATFSNDAEVTKGDFTSIQSGELKWTVLGNRSPRDAALAVTLQPGLTEVASAATNVNARCVEANGLVDFDDLTDAFADWFKKQAPAPSDAAARAELDTLFAGVTLNPVQQKAISACADAIVLKQSTATQFVANMATLTEAYLALNKQHQLSIAVSSHRDAKVDDFATFKILYGKNTAPKLSVNFNGEANFNQHHDSKNLHEIRSFAFEGGVTMGRFNDNRFDATFSGKLWRNNDTTSPKDKNVSMVQIKGNVYLASSLVLPVSFSYANRPFEAIKKGFQMNVGIASLLDSLLAKPLAATQ